MGQKVVQFKRCDHYTTPQKAWEDILRFIPKSTELWLPFFHDGEAGRIVRSLGYCNVVHENQDFFQSSPRGLVIDNPPYSRKREIVEHLFDSKSSRPFALLMPLGTLGCQYMRAFTNGLQVLIPRSRYKFDNRGNVPFKACWFCWNMSEFLQSDHQLVFC